MNVHNIGRYEVIEVLGQGAMGVVYLARDPIIDRKLAVKTLRLDLDREFADEFRERFMREARAAGRLSHTGIVTIHDVGEDPATKSVFIAMEYIHGRDLKEMLSAGHRFRPSEAARIAAGVAEALDYAHSMGVVHRDIKPANIILTKDGTVKIMDFGVARLESSNLTVEGQFIGTPNFMSPEQITGKPVDGRSDIFSLGVLLFNLLTGQRPFSGSTIHEVTFKIANEKCPIPTSVLPGLPPAFNPVILKCMEKDPDKRFQDGAQIARVLGALASSLVDRESGDMSSTVVVKPNLQTQIRQPDEDDTQDRAAPPAPAQSFIGDETRAAHETRTISPNTAAIRHRSAAKDGPTFREKLETLPLPSALVREVNPKYAGAIVASVSALVILVVTILSFSIDRGPFPSPSDGRIISLHRATESLDLAQQLERSNDLVGASKACRAALDQVPSSRAGRTLMTRIRNRINSEITNQRTEDRIGELIHQGRGLYRDRRYDAAADRFEEVLRLDSGNDIAASFLELIDERTQAPQPTPNQLTALNTVTRATPTPAPRRQRAALRPTPGRARITCFFNSPISEGQITITLDGKVMTNIPFNFTKKILGIKRRGSGQIKEVLMVPAGRHRLGVELVAPEVGSLGQETFETSFNGDSDWTLRIDLAKNSSQADFFLVPVR